MERIIEKATASSSALEDRLPPGTGHEGMVKKKKKSNFRHGVHIEPQNNISNSFK